LKSYKKDKSQVASLNNKLQAVLKEQDYNAFLLEELLSAQLKPGQQEDFESIYQQLNNVEFIKENLDKSLALANEEQYGILQNLKELKLALQKTAHFSNEYQSLTERVQSVAIEFDDIVNELQELSESLVNDPDQLDFVNQKLQSIYNLQKKHQVTTVEELLDIQSDLDNKAVSVVTLEAEILELESQIQEAVLKLDNFAQSITDNRMKAVPVLSQKLIAILEQLGMPHVRFSMEITPSTTYLPQGKDELQFLFSANKGSDFGLLKKVASGGEMSRIMLATKAILAQYSNLPTIIFDEIDTGVSGEIANKMGDIMKEMSIAMQVFAITHLPQIAAKGNVHFKVFKSTVGEQTQSELKKLHPEERVLEIAQMLSGTVVSDSAINHAKALLN
jgi:DNA repair protein RecN (Recombination protein N)